MGSGQGRARSFVTLEEIGAAGSEPLFHSYDCGKTWKSLKQYFFFYKLQCSISRYTSDGWQERLSQWGGHTGTRQLQSKAVLVGMSFFNSMSCNSFHMSWGKIKLTEFPWKWEDNFLLWSRMELKVKIKL